MSEFINFVNALWAFVRKCCVASAKSLVRKRESCGRHNQVACLESETLLEDCRINLLCFQGLPMKPILYSTLNQ